MSECVICRKLIWFWQRWDILNNLVLPHGPAHEKCEVARVTENRAYLLSGKSPLGGMPAVVEEILKRNHGE